MVFASVCVYVACDEQIHARAVGGEVEIICDGGVRRGSDVVKAVAAGATVAATGRAYLYGRGAADMKSFLAVVLAVFLAVFGAGANT